MDIVLNLIKKTILEIEKPFLMSELFKVLEGKGIKDRRLILRVLDQLLDDGLVDYKDMSDNDVIYYSLLSTVPA